MKKLPNKPSELIRLAVSDIQKVAKDPKYGIYMGTWHWKDNDGKCYVCLAGAVLAKTLKISRRKSIDPFTLTHPILGLIPAPKSRARLARQLIALNSFREGNVRSGLQTLGYDLSVYDTFRDSYSYINGLYDGPAGKFIPRMLGLANELERAGL